MMTIDEQIKEVIDLHDQYAEVRYPNQSLYSPTEFGRDILFNIVANIITNLYGIVCYRIYKFCNCYIYK